MATNKEEINSHKYIPKVILKQFQNHQGAIYLYDFETQKYKSSGSKAINTKKGFFSKEVEEFFNKDYEGNVGRIIKQIQSSISEDKLILSKELTKSIYEYIKFVFIRSPYINKNLFNNITQKDTDSLIKFGITLFEDKNFLENINLTILINYTDIPFVLPLKCFYDVYTEQFGKQTIISLTERISLVLFNEEDSNKYKIKNELVGLYVNDNKMVDKLNLFAIKNQKKTNNGFIVCSNLSYLKSLIGGEII